MSKFKILLVVLFAALVNINFSYAQIWSAITGNNTLNINGASVGIGTTTQTKKFEIWDGTTPGKFTFSVPSCTTSYEVSQTLDDTGYKLNVLSSARNYKVAINGTDRFKLLSNDNVGLGTNSLSSITSASNNIGIGANSLKSTTSGVYNIAIGTSTLNSVINGSHNIAIGANSLYNTTTGIYNIAIGSMAMSINNTGSFNSALGCSAGQLYSNNMYSVYLGAYSKSQADNQTNQIVIGYNAIGNGSNTVTLGNDNITGTILKGNVGIGTATPTQALNVVGRIGVSPSGTGSDEGYNGGLMITKPQASGQYINLIRSGIVPWSIGTVYNSSTFAIGIGKSPDAGFTAPFFNIDTNGNVGIGTTIPDSKLTVNGKIHATEVVVDVNIPADYVFNSTYKLMPLHEVEQYVNINSHLPQIPSADEIKKNGMSMGEMQNKLLQKIEELTLYIIDQQKKIEVLEQKVK